MSSNRCGHKITLLTTGLDVGGAEQQVVLLAEHLTARGHKVEVVSMLSGGSFAPRVARCSTVHQLGMRRGVPDPRAAFKLASLLRRFRPHILHCHMVHANLLGRVTRLMAPVPVLISTAHSTQEGGRLRDFAYKATDFLSDMTTQVSRAGFDRYVRKRLVPPAKCLCLPNGVDVARIAPGTTSRASTRRALGWSDRFVFLAVGNLREPKDYPNMLNAFATLGSSEETTLAIAGSGPLQDELSALVEELSLRDRVQMLGTRHDISDLMGAADAYVMSSSREGTPIALLEAAACELPIVATNVGGNADIIQSGVTGLLVPPGDHQKLGKAMAALRGMNQADRQRMGSHGRKLVASRYDASSIVDRWENLYSQLLEIRYNADQKGFRRLPAAW